MDIDEYERRGWAACNAFGIAISAVLRAAIDAEDGYRLQQVKERAKQPSSLREKLEGRGIAGTTTLEDDINDLTGCRIIFYTNTDVTRFVGSGIIDQNFEVIGAKIHHPGRAVEDAAELYMSNHFIKVSTSSKHPLSEYFGRNSKFCTSCVDKIVGKMSAAISST